MPTIEQGRVGRIFYIRVHPNEDLVSSLEKVYTDHGLARAIVRSSVGSLAHCCLESSTGRRIDITGPAVEILNMTGEIFTGADGEPVARVNGMVLDINAQYHAGRFVRGRNPACMTVEAVLEEWVAEKTLGPA